MSRDPGELVARAGRGDPGRDQHFLVDDRVLERLPEYLPGRAERVLEIGAGTGGLTDRLLGRFDAVTAIERDPELVRFLRAEFADEIAAGRLEVVQGDALDVELPRFDGCVSNLPYGVASQILFRLLPRRCPMALMFQREFADRLVAAAGSSEYGRVTVTAGHYASISIAEVIPPTAFDPSPPVESALAVFEPRPPSEDLVDEEVFFDLVRAVFTQRRKTLRNAIRNTTHISGITDATTLLEATPGAVLKRRPGDLSPTEYVELANLVVSLGVIDG